MSNLYQINTIILIQVGKELIWHLIVYCTVENNAISPLGTPELYVFLLYRLPIPV